jgi:branched-chain amino acid transport system permease protein
MNTAGTVLGRRWAACAGIAAAIAGLGAFMPEFAALQAANWAVFGLLAMSLTLVWGHAGIFSFGQGAFFGAGAYAYGIAAINLMPHTNETISGLLAGAVAGAALAAAVGYFMFYGKVGDVYVGIITLAMTLVLFTVMSSTADPRYRVGEAQLGGYNGMSGVPPLSWGWPGGDGPAALSSTALLCVVVLLCAAVLAGTYWLLDRPFGRVLAALRENELRTQLLGFDVRLRKLLVFTAGGAIAGLAGALYAAWAMFVSPIVFGLQQAAMVVIWVLVGGRASLAGAFVGALLVEALSSTLGGGGGAATPIVLGAVLIGVVLFLPQGVVPALQRLAALRRRIERHEAADESRPAPVPSDTMPVTVRRRGAALRADRLSKRFGGVQAVRQASLAFGETGVHCLIGPNGAGKSTVFNMLVGRFPPTSGEVLLNGRPITRAEPHERVRLGLGIKLQVASIFAALPVRENLWLAAYARLRDGAAAAQRATQLLDWLGLRGRAEVPAGALSHGQKQWLEMAMVLACEPSVVLLDEPTAGMTREETARTAALVRLLGRDVSVVVVEHDMEFVRALDVPVTVFHQGSVFASGSLDELRRDARVLDIYLGRHEPEAA